MSSTESSDDERRPAGWLPDPYGRHERRWWDGRVWSGRVSDAGRFGIDPPIIDPRPAASPLDEPAQPIDDALEPLRGPDDRTLIGLIIGALVLVGLLLYVVLALL